MSNSVEAMIFDLDGVITFTARLHAAAWKELFDEYLKIRSSRRGEQFRPFDVNTDYPAYVDGKSRYDGVRSFRESRGIKIPEGTPSDPVNAETVRTLGNRKDALFVKKVREMGVDVDHEAVRFVRELRGRGVRVGLASSSRNAVPVLERAGIKDIFEAIVDGVVSEHLRLQGKPAPDIFLHCLAGLVPRADSRHAGIVEDAIAGVEAGKAGGFGLVLGVDRKGSRNLKVHGANWVIHDFKGVTAERVFEFFTDRIRAA